MLVPQIDLTTGDFVITNDKLQFYPAYVYKVNRQVMQKIGQDIYNGIDNGNPLLTKPTLPARSEVVQGINYALAPLLEIGEIELATVVNYVADTQTGRGTVGLTVNAPNNPPVEITIPL